MCRRMVCDCENPTVDLFCCPECDPRLSSQCLHQNGETLYNSGDTWVQDCRQCRCLVSSAAWGRSPGECEAQNLGGRQPCLPAVPCAPCRPGRHWPCRPEACSGGVVHVWGVPPGSRKGRPLLRTPGPPVYIYLDTTTSRRMVFMEKKETFFSKPNFLQKQNYPFFSLLKIVTVDAVLLSTVLNMIQYVTLIRILELNAIFMKLLLETTGKKLNTGLRKKTPIFFSFDQTSCFFLWV